jgi:predicted alpha-1,2-mannosidase
MLRFTLFCLLLSTGVFAQQLTRFVDPFTGTGGHGHVFPGAAYPFGMIQLSPDNGDTGWDWCSGYHYSSNTIAGFSHTHLSGTGIGDWCDISLLPLNDTVGASAKFIKQPFSHQNEQASPGFYAVQFNNGIKAALTTSERVGYHRYTFPTAKAFIRFDMGFAINWDSCTAASMHLVNDSTLAGYRFSTGWAKNQRVYFAAVFSEPVRSFRFLGADSVKATTASGNALKVLLEFNQRLTPINIRVAISSTSEAGALNNLKGSNTNDFDRVVKQTSLAWEKALQKIQIDTGNKEQSIKFYTALYRTCVAPVLFSDLGAPTKYTVFSLWDTFRSLHPLYTITQPKMVPDFINSLLQFYKEHGLLPVWDLSNSETNTMTGYHAVPVIADAILKGIKGFDYALAFEAIKKSANQHQRGTPDYLRFGYLPQDKHGWSVTITLEYAFDDWCIAQVAKKLGRPSDYSYYQQRSKSYQRLFDAGTGFMRGKDSTGKFIEPFDPLLSEHGFDGQYIEGTAWQHSFFVPHDIDGLAALHGSRQALAKKIDALFQSESVLHGENTSVDVSGLIGQYAHGNEPSHHIIYMYTKLGYPAAAAEKIQLVADSMYKNGPDGLSGNDDCGQMSAWLIWACLGMYPLNPASGEYVFGYPLVARTVLSLPNGKKLTISRVEKNSNGKTGITRVFLNKRQISSTSIQHAQLLAGGELVIEIGKK